ncbi:DUF4178 domain-containing protein [Mycolicibacterium diernhoferi]|uniref:DUF4178 domain-containing protein n=1 Tax=Mycolicibacterium diernhoferi TaxID=1801 RepID=A0A1Q4HG36_9MYCO|nr:DUF4178 domain-containing protein [Mycolicibacterium diernhoferi]OJZ66477.1 hypothetical protein BRW64_09415 [Mycolicibacterium diernhoferi]OPE55430.1 hypothetical protein BV510_05195 [Mycolicibacterium diernhoferi]PEG56353.1 DUF4178 domain-containing protein [Mycolicibacterium diernhoferi]QYL24653.1 DUF4178 domain-containing protein [Mycolicibacterium diernhoferi]
MGELLVILAIALLAAGVIVFLVARNRPKQPAQPAARQDPLRFASQTETFGPRQLGPGAIVSHGGIDYVVRGSVTLREGPFVWWEHLLEGGPEPVWFSVEEDEGRLELVWWVKSTGLPPGLPSEPGSSIDVDGVTYSVDENGRASYTTEGTTGLPAGGEMDYIDYSTAGGEARLGYERWAPTMAWEVSHGTPVRPGELTVYPAPPAGS